MRITLLLAMAVALWAEEAQASDRPVPASTLAAVGLPDLQMLNDAQGNEVRGMHRGAKAFGKSIISALILDPESNSFIVGTDANSATASVQGRFAASQQTSAVAVSLIVEPSGNFSGFSSAIIGGAGGSAFAKN
jgi:hypothetical protein